MIELSCLKNTAGIKTIGRLLKLYISCMALISPWAKVIVFSTLKIEISVKFFGLTSYILYIWFLLKTITTCKCYLQAIQKGNIEGAKIHAENAIRQKNQVI